MLPGYTATKRPIAANAPFLRYLGHNSIGPTINSATPLSYVQKLSFGGNHGGTMSLKNFGLTKCMTPASVMNAPIAVAIRPTVLEVIWTVWWAPNVDPPSCARRDSNSQPSDPKSDALSIELRTHFVGNLRPRKEMAHWQGLEPRTF